MLLPKSERAAAARRFVEANDRVVIHSTPNTRAEHQVRWSALLNACGGDADLAMAEASAALAPRVVS